MSVSKQDIYEFLCQTMIYEFDNNTNCTHYLYLEENRLGNIYMSIVCGYVENNLCVKFAYKPLNCPLSDYNFDWLMPVLKNGEIFDTEVCLDDTFGLKQTREVATFLYDCYKEFVTLMECDKIKFN